MLRIVNSILKGYEMIDAPHTRTDRRMRLGGSNVLRHMAPKPTGIISIGTRQHTVSVLGAVHTDIHVASQTPLSIGQRLTFIISSSGRGPEIGIPGVVHWNNSAQGGVEAGIALLEPLPDEIAVKLPGCERNSIRYACRIHGKLHWIEGGPKSQSAVVLNYSRDGMCLQASLPVPVETNIQYVWQTGQREERIEGIVRWVIGQDDGFMTGCELVKEPGYLLSGIRI